MAPQDLTPLDPDVAPALDGLPIVRHSFGGGAALFVAVGFLVLAGGGIWLHDSWPGIRYRMSDVQPDVPAYLIDPDVSADTRLSQLNETVAAEGSPLLNRPLSRVLRETLDDAVSAALAQIGVSSTLQDTDVGRQSSRPGHVMRPSVLERRIVRDHARLLLGDVRDMHAFLMLYRDNPFALSSGYVSSAEAMLAAAMSGRSHALAGKSAVDEAFEKIGLDDPQSVQTFVMRFGTNPYARQRGYVDAALTMQSRIDQKAEDRERRERVRQKDTEWVWD